MNYEEEAIRLLGTPSLNGTPPALRTELFQEALTAVREAKVALAKTFPHARDYVLDPFGLHGEAMKNYWRHEKALQTMEEELSTQTFHLSQQEDPRSAKVIS